MHTRYSLTGFIYLLFWYITFVSCVRSFDCINYLTLSFRLNNVQTKGYLSRSNIIHLSKNNEEKCEKFEILRIEAIQISPLRNSYNLFYKIFNYALIESIPNCLDIFFEILYSKYFRDFFLSFVAISLVSILNSFAYSFDIARLKFKTSAIKFFVFFLFLSLFAYGSCASIIRNIPVCKETTKSYDIDSACKDIECVTYKNILYQLSNLDDVFNYIYTADLKSVIVYSNKGRVFQTECEIIQSYDLIAKQNCTKYVAVSFQLKYAQIVGYLSRQNIIRLKVNKDDDCQNSNEEKDFGIYDKDFKLYKKGDQIGISGRNDSSQEIDFEDQNQLLEVYDETFGSSFPKLLRDTFFFIIGLFVFVSTLYKIILKIKSKKNLAKKTINVSRKLCCWYKLGKKALEPTTQITSNKLTSAFNPSISQQSAHQPVHFFQQQASDVTFPSAPPATSYQTSYQEGGTDMYHTIGNNLPYKYNSTTSLYQQRMPTRSCSTISIKEEPYEGISGPYDTICPHCPKYPPPKWPKYCKGEIGLALHKSKAHNIK